MSRRRLGAEGGNASASDASNPLAPFGSNTGATPKRRLLLIDDSATVRAALSARLTIRGHEVRAAGSLVETTLALAEFAPEFVISDVRMPDVEGDDLCRRIKAAMRQPVPVILYSSLPKRELSARARAAGADGFVCKTEGIDALMRRMDEILAFGGDR